MTGCSEFIEFLRAEILAACGDEAEAVADRIEREVRLAFGAERVYVPALPDSRRTEAMRLLSAGMPPDQVARKVSAHTATIYRWRKSTKRRPRATGLGSDDWVL